MEFPDAEAEKCLGKLILMINNFTAKCFYINVLAQTAPDYDICLLPEFWRFRHGEPWENHFVTVAKIVLGKVVHAYVPILPAEYRSNPTLWPRGTIGTCLTLKWFFSFDFQLSKFL